QQRADGGRGHAVLSGAGLGDDTPLSHPLRQQRLPQRVVQLVRAGVKQILPLEVDAGAQRERLRQAVGPKQRRRPPRVGAQQARQLVAIAGVRARRGPGRFQLVQRGDQRLWNEAAAVRAEAPPPVGRRDRLLRQDRRHFVHLEAPRAPRTNARTRSGSLYPSGPSIPPATSTPEGRASAMACATFSGVNPPPTNSSPSWISRAFTASFQGKLF